MWRNWRHLLGDQAVVCRSISRQWSIRSWRSTRTAIDLDSISLLQCGRADRPFKASKVRFEPVWILCLALPDHPSAIALGPQCSCDASVANTIVREFLQPE